MSSIKSLTNTKLNKVNIYNIITLTELSRENEFSNLILFDNCCFEDDIWDLSKNNIHNLPNSSFIFNFSDIDYVYKNYIKTYVLRRLFSSEKRTQTIHKEFDNMVELTNWFIEEGIVNLESINEYEIRRYFYNLINNEGTKTGKKKNIASFLAEIEIKNPSADFKACYEFLNKKNVELLAAEKEEGKYKLIPTSILNKIVSNAILDIDNCELDDIDRIGASMIVLLAETGMRVGEFVNLQIEKLKEITVHDNKQVFYYLSFITYKTTGNDEGYWTKTFMSDNAVKAYRFLEKFLSNRRELNSYLYCNENSEPYSQNALQRHIRRFFFRHKDDLEIDSLTDIEKENFRTWIIKDYNVKAINLLSKSDIGKTIYFVTAHQFRVYVATMLYKKGYSLDWIRQHMNHMSAMMTEHYIRIEELERNRKNTVEALLNRASKKTGLLETDKDNLQSSDLKEELTDEELMKAYNDINRFLKKKKLNIFKDIDEILTLLQKVNTPGIESDLGFCASKGLVKLCERQEYISSINDAYYVGVKLPAVEEIEFSYTRFNEKVKIINHNKKLKEANPKVSREYEKEVKAMEKYVDRKLLPEILELQHLIGKDGKEKIIDKYPGLKDIVININDIYKEVYEWRKKIS